MTVTWETLRQLAGFRAAKGCAISLYLDLDPRESPTAADAATRVNSLVDQGLKSNGANRSEQTHEQRVGLREDFERIKHYFGEEFDRDGAHGFALFCGGLDNLWEVLPLSEPVPDGIKVGTELYLAPLVPLVGRGEGAVVAVVSREEGLLYRLRAGRLERIADLFEEQHGQHDQGGWSQARYQRHIEERAKNHLKTVAEVLERQLRQLRFPPVVIVCPEELKSEFGDLLAADARASVIGWTTAKAHASATTLYDVARPVLERWRERRETEVVERWREEAG
ncbi:MAG TPA: Vms1/Ankzf1 family peptidyl-tRNA hydrolase, partial [Gaiellaceae bacterium]|nr:Vms1/Ankzf1 family peptidyl-tRNA hydrolase [Gaiellaceae bacterium]